MKISLNWLKKYVSFDMTPGELSHRLTMVGLEVEETHSLGGVHIENVIAGRVLTVEKHPDADKLSVCTVDTGAETLTVVCGAPNVAVDQIVPVAMVGAVLGDGFEIQKRKIRGITSNGMICSEKELGLGSDHEGIMVLDKEKYQPGTLFSANHEPSDTMFVINVTPNRPDCLSHIGIAREIAALTGQKLQYPQISIREEAPPASESIAIDIQDAHACPRYSARVVRDVRVGPSPKWLKDCLESVGLRSINNIVDITNFVLMETGHPLHAFDYDLIENQRMVIRKASENECFTTLDGKQRILTSDDLLICDGKKGIALAGIMGGQNSEVSDRTRHVLLEGAFFDAFTVRQTAKRLGLSTDASQRFERGADPNGTLYAIDRAAQLMSEIAGGKVSSGSVDEYPKPVSPGTLDLRLSRVNQLLGTDIPRSAVLDILTHLELTVSGSGDTLTVTVPTFRPDLTKEVDLIEEVVRHYGYDQIPLNFHVPSLLTHHVNHVYALCEKLRDLMCGLGFYEAITNSLVSRRHTEIDPSMGPAVEIQNPMSPETAFLRTSIVPSLLDAAQWNRNRQQSHVRLFEIGNSFQARQDGLPREELQLVALMTGVSREKPFWGDTQKMCDFYTVKGLAEVLGEALHISDWRFLRIVKEHPLLVKESAVRIESDNSAIGFIGEIREDICNDWNLDMPVFVLQIAMGSLLAVIPEKQSYQPIPRFPSIRRDMAVVVDEGIHVGDLLDSIRRCGGPLLSDVDVFDLYKGRQISKGKKSVAFSLCFQSGERTLQESEVDPLMDEIISNIRKAFDAQLRS